MPYRVLIIGLGRIGMGYDLDKDPERYVLSHVRAFQRHERFVLVGGVDADTERRRLFEDRFGCPAFEAVDAVVRRLQPEVVVVATPTRAHATTVREVLAAGPPRAMLCEKPLATEFHEAREIVESCRQKGCALFVNYMRRSDVTVAEIRRRLDSGQIQSPINGVAWYSNGLYNSASHFVNLLQYLLGEVLDVRVLSAARRMGGSDLQPDFGLTFKGGNVHFIAARAESLFHNTLEWITPNGRLRYERGGAVASWENKTSDPAYSGYGLVGFEAETFTSDFHRVQWHVVDQLCASLEGKQARICTGDDALRTNEVLARIEEQL